MTLQEKFDSIIDCIERLVYAGESDIPQALARESGFNLRLLGDAFQFIADMTLIKYIRQRRLVRALSNRIEFNLPVEEVVSDAGFSDAAAFSKACKNEFDLTPIQITEDVLKKYTPLSFAMVASGRDVDQMENDTLIATKNDTICGVSAQQFAEIKQVLELGAIYGLSDEEAEFVYRLATDRKLTLAKAAEFYDDFKLQIENGSNIPSLDLFETAELACQYNLSYSEAQAIMYELGCHGYLSIRNLPDGFFDIYFCEENDRRGWDVPYMCEIAETLEEHEFSAADLDDMVDLASAYGISIIEAIEDYKSYKNDWDTSMRKLMHYNDSAEDPCGFGYRSIWELDEGQESLPDVADEDEDDATFQEDNFDDVEDDSEAVFLARKYRIPLREALELKRDLESYGYYSIDDLPQGFFEIYFSYDIDQFVGWDIPYVCEIAEAMAQKQIPMDRLDDVMYLASKHNVDPGDVIENIDHYSDL